MSLTATQRQRISVKSSAIHGKGVFASKPIRKGVHLGEYAGKRTMEDGIHVLWVEDDEVGQFGIDGKNVLRFLNHSAVPNAEFDGEHLYAIRGIKGGEEITFHYGEEWDD